MANVPLQYQWDSSTEEFVTTNGKRKLVDRTIQIVWEGDPEVRVSLCSNHVI